MHEGELLLRDVLLQWPSLMALDEDLANILDLDEPLLEEMHKDLAADKAKTKWKARDTASGARYSVASSISEKL